jgi:hypothetical protein
MIIGHHLAPLDDSSYETATRVRDLDPGLPIDDLERIEGVVDSIADALDASWLEALRSSSRSRRLSPAAFRYQLARAAGARVVLHEGTGVSHRAGRGRVRRARDRPQRPVGSAGPGHQGNPVQDASHKR